MRLSRQVGMNQADPVWALNFVGDSRFCKLNPGKKMKTKICAVCQKEETTLYRVQLTKGKIWIFICTDCCNKAKGEPNYRYGGTWKGDRH